MKDPNLEYFGIEFREKILGILLGQIVTSCFVLPTILVFLAMHQDVQDELFMEIKEILQENNNEITYESINKMKYLDRVFNEFLRHTYPLPLSPRENITKLEIGNEILPENSIIIICQFYLHKRKDIWGENFDKFYPDHFLPENSAKRHIASFVPFGLVSILQTLVLFLASLIFF